MRDVENFQSFAIDHERVAELHGDAASVFQKRFADFGGDSWLKWIVEVDDDQAAIAKDIRVDTGDRDATGAVQFSFWIER